VWRQSTAAGAEDTMKSLGEKFKEEVRALIPPAIFFLIAFHILVFFRALMLRQYGVHVSAVAGATIGALLIAKVVLIADALPFVNRFPEKPLIYNVVWKTAIYLLAALLVHYLEHLVPLWWRGRDLVAAHERLLQETVWPHFWAVQLWLLVLLFIYCAARELVRAVGPREVLAMYFGGPAARIMAGPAAKK
jgi:hypothetical protein